METSGVNNCDLCPFYGESGEALHYHKAKCHGNFFGHREASSAASMLPLPPGFPAFPGLFNAAVQSQHHGDPASAYHQHISTYNQTAGAQQALQQAHQQQQQAVVQAAHHQLQARFGAESVKIPGSLGAVASNAVTNTHHPATTLPSSSSLHVQQAQAAQAQAAQQAAAAAAQQQQHHEQLQRQRQAEAEQRLQQETQRLQEFSKEFSNLQDHHSSVRNPALGGHQPTAAPLRHPHQNNEQVQAENYTQNNGQPSSGHGPGIGSGQGGGQDLRHSANVTPIPAPVMGKHSSYNYRARNDGDPVVKPTEVTIVKMDGERVSQADLKAAAEAAEAARIASAKAEEERLQAERLAAEQLAAQKDMNGEPSPSTMQDIKPVMSTDTTKETESEHDVLKNVKVELKEGDETLDSNGDMEDRQSDEKEEGEIPDGAKTPPNPGPPQTTKKEFDLDAYLHNKCQFCGFIAKVGGQKELREHIGEKHEPFRDIKCPTCGEVFRSRLKLALHIKDTHLRARGARFDGDGPGKNVKCPTCKQFFENRQKLALHIQEKHLQERIQRLGKEDDDDDYFGDGPLGQKMPKPEPEPGEMIPDEPTTGKKGKRKKKKKGLKAGIKANPEGKTKLIRKPKLKRLGTFPCDRCGKMFKRTDHLLRHIRETHNNIKKYHCEYEGCLHQTSDRHRMVEHVEAMHLKIKKHICDKCGHATSWPQCLAKHMFIMHGVGTGKIYTCDICGYVTKYRSNFKNHKKNKHDIGDQKPGLCTTCGKTYKTRTYLWDHVYRVHMKRRKGQGNHFPRDSEGAQAMRREMAKHMGTL